MRRTLAGLFTAGLLVVLSGLADAQRQTPQVKLGDTLQIGFSMDTADQTCLKPIGNLRLVVQKCTVTSGTVGSFFMRAYSTSGGFLLNAIAGDTVSPQLPVVVPPTPPPTPAPDTAIKLLVNFDHGFGRIVPPASGWMSITTVGCHTGSCVDIALPKGGCCGASQMEVVQTADSLYGTAPYIKWWVKFPVGFLLGDSTISAADGCGSGATCGTNAKLLYLYGYTGAPVGYFDTDVPCGIQASGNAGCGSMKVFYVSDGDTASLWGPTVTPDGLWHSVEVHPNNATHTMTVWWDGAQIIQGQSVLSNGVPYYDLKFGIYENNRWPTNQHLYIDDICVSTTRCP